MEKRNKREYVAPVSDKTMFGKRFIEVADLDHPEAVQDLINLLRKFHFNEKKVEIRFW